MSETPGDYQVGRAAEAIRFEKQMTEQYADVLLAVIRNHNQTARLDANVWRCIVQAVYERIGEVVNA